MPIVTDLGFQTERKIELIQIDDIGTLDTGQLSILLVSDDDPTRLIGLFERIELIVITFASFDDGRGFSLARRLRALGYRGHLRARGHVISDQYLMVRSCGFDDVEIDQHLAARQPEAHWLEAGKLTASYRRKLAGTTPHATPAEDQAPKAA